jgi:hypothetical protein
MGNKAILIVVLTIIIFTAILIPINQKQLKSADKLTDSTYESKARQLANSHMQSAIKAFIENPIDSGIIYTDENGSATVEKISEDALGVKHYKIESTELSEK